MNLKRKEPVKFEPLPLTGEKHDMLLKDIAPKEKGIKIFLDLDTEILDSGKSKNPEAEYLKKYEENEKKEKSSNYRTKLFPDVVEK